MSVFASKCVYLDQFPDLKLKEIEIVATGNSFQLLLLASKLFGWTKTKNISEQRSEARTRAAGGVVCGVACWTDAACDVTDEEDDNQDSSEDLNGDNEICGHSLSTSPASGPKSPKPTVKDLQLFYVDLL